MLRKLALRSHQNKFYVQSKATLVNKTHDFDSKKMWKGNAAFRKEYFLLECN